MNSYREYEARRKQACSECMILKLSCDPPGSHCPKYQACFDEFRVADQCDD